METDRGMITGEAIVELTEPCPNCGKPIDVAFACSECRRIDEARVPGDFFDLLGVDATFNLDLSVLRRRFLALSRFVHPDSFGFARENADAAVRISAKLNEAYDVLRQPVRRAAYLLERSGAAESEADRTVPPDVLMDTMSLRERIEKANEANDRTELAALADEIARKQVERNEQMVRCARQLDVTNEASRSQLRQALNALIYYDKMMDSLWSAHDGGAKEQENYHAS